jgi:transposase-like protein
MATQRRYSIEFKRQVVQEYQAGETLHGLAERHGISRNLVRIWGAKAEAGEFDDDLAAASILQEYEARIGALERLVGKLTLENEFLKGASRYARPPTSATTSVVAGPPVSRSPKDAD